MNRTSARVLAHISFASYPKLQLLLLSLILKLCSSVLGVVWILTLKDVLAVPLLWDSAKIQQFFQLPFSGCCNSAVRKTSYHHTHPEHNKINGPPAAALSGGTHCTQEVSAQPRVPGRATKELAQPMAPSTAPLPVGQQLGLPGVPHLLATQPWRWWNLLISTVFCTASWP